MDDPEYTDWEALTSATGEDLGCVCPGCITAAEQQAMDNDGMEVEAELTALAAACARCLKAVPYETDDPAEGLPDGWYVLDTDESVDAGMVLVCCRDCINNDGEVVNQ